MGMLDREVDGGDTSANSIVSKILSINEAPVAISNRVGLWII